MKKNRIFHGPVNIGGIGGYLADYQRKQGYDAQFIVWQKNPMLLNHDQVIFEGRGRSFKSIYIRLLLGVKWMFQFDVYNFYFGSSLLPFSLDLPLLRLMGKRVVMIYCGSDARLVSVERKRNPFWHLVEGDLKGTLNDRKYDMRKKVMMLWQGLWCHKILAPRNLYKPVSMYISKKKIVKDIWIHNLSFSSREKYVNTKKEKRYGSTLRLVHIPSSPQVKGSHYFREVIASLKDEGFDFEYHEVTGVSHAEAMNTLRRADVVLDQLLLGGFGSLSVEGMSVGKPVVCYMLDCVKKEHYSDCPVVNANIDTLKEELKKLLLDPGLRKDLGKRGKIFVERHFDYDEMNRAMLECYK